MDRPSWVAITCNVICLFALYLLLPGRPRETVATGGSGAGSSKGLLRPSMPFGAFSFEVHGRVQGVFFRKFTVAKAKALHLVGWCANTQRGTVVGECQGKPQALEEMKEWLCTEGSPHSHIERCDFKHERSIDELTYETFERRPNVP